jgi:tripartite-type tricarboxylate transporter receptor subunit TctC
VREGLGAPEFVEGLAARGLVPLAMAQEEFAAMFRREHDRWGTVAKATGFVAED